MLLIDSLLSTNGIADPIQQAKLSLFIYLSLYLYIYQSASLSVCLSVCLLSTYALFCAEVSFNCTFILSVISILII